jgi:hypothetical protein
MQRFGMSTREIAKVTGTASTVVYTMPQVGHIGLIRLVVVSREPNPGGGVFVRVLGRGGGYGRDAPAIAVTVAGVPEDRPYEQVARHIVRHALPSVTVVTQHEDGSRDSMVDALITYPDGRTAAPEIVGDYDASTALCRRGLRGRGKSSTRPR